MHAHATRLAKLLGLFAIAFIGSAGAQQSLQSYDVELIVFRTLSSQATPEEWRVDSGTTQSSDDEDALDAETTIAPAPTAPTMTFPALPPAKFKLTALADTLRRSRNYRPLAHFGWTQPGFVRGDARYMSIDGLVPADAGITGKVALSRGRYLHLTLELVYHAPDGQPMVLRQTRRMRSNERHYLDHPAFGVIAVITPSAG